MLDIPHARGKRRRRVIPQSANLWGPFGAHPARISNDWLPRFLPPASAFIATCRPKLTRPSRWHTLRANSAEALSYNRTAAQRMAGGSGTSGHQAELHKNNTKVKNNTKHCIAALRIMHDLYHSYHFTRIPNILSIQSEQVLSMPPAMLALRFILFCISRANRGHGIYLCLCPALFISFPSFQLCLSVPEFDH